MSNGGFSPGVKRLERVANHSLVPKLRMNGVIPLFTNTSPWRDTKLSKETTSPCVYQYYTSQDGSVGIGTGYGLDDRIIGVRFTAGAGNFSLRHRIQTDSEAHPTSYPMGRGGSFPGGRAAGA
jgi:hypothetical protein